MPLHTTALVLFSGGQDSTTCLADALSKYQRVETLGFDYGQRHRVELDVRGTILAQLRERFPDWAPRLGEDHVLTLAAYRRGLQVIVTGVCETDFSGYPDCRDDTMKAMQLALSLGLERRLVIETPLMWIDKAETWQMAQRLGGEPLVELIVEETHTCYLGDRVHRQAWGYGCGECPACDLRKKGWERYSDQAAAG
jgi:7-cyano-7-deazaguanine synthase